MKPTHAQLVNLLREIVTASPPTLPGRLEQAREVLCLTDAALSTPAAPAPADLVKLVREWQRQMRAYSRTDDAGPLIDAHAALLAFPLPEVPDGK